MSSSFTFSRAREGRTGEGKRCQVPERPPVWTSSPCGRESVISYLSGCSFLYLLLPSAREKREREREGERRDKRRLLSGKERIPRRSFLVPQVNLFLGAPDLIVPFLLLVFLSLFASRARWGEQGRRYQHLIGSQFHKMKKPIFESQSMTRPSLSLRRRARGREEEEKGNDWLPILESHACYWEPICSSSLPHRLSGPLSLLLIGQPVTPSIRSGHVRAQPIIS